MGLDLSLLPYDADVSIQYSHTILRCEMFRSLSDSLLELEQSVGVDVADGFSSYMSQDDKFEESHYGETTITPYGDRLRYVLVEHLLRFKLHKEVRDNERNGAVWAYLACLHPKTKVALYWN